jgi:hypothetical protein
MRLIHGVCHRIAIFIGNLCQAQYEKTLMAEQMWRSCQPFQGRTRRQGGTINGRTLSQGKGSWQIRKHSAAIGGLAAIDQMPCAP